MRLEALKSSFMDLSTDPIAVGYLAPDATAARVVYVNTAFTETFGHTPEDILGESVERVHSPDAWVRPCAQARFTGHQKGCVSQAELIPITLGADSYLGFPFQVKS